MISVGGNTTALIQVKDEGTKNIMLQYVGGGLGV